MPWLTQPREPTLAELFGSGAISGGGGISSGLLRPPPNQWEEALAKVLPAIKEYIQRKKSDQIANQLQNMYQPPRAKAVDPRMQGAPPTMPFTGGADQFQVAEMYRQRQQEAEDRELKRKQITAEINSKGESRVPVDVDGKKLYVTPNAALEFYGKAKGDGLTPYQRERLRRGEMETLHKSIPPYSRALRRGKIDEDGDFTNNYEGAATGDYAEVLTPDGSKIIVPWSEYERATRGATNPAIESYRGVQQQQPTAKWKESPSEDFRPTTSYDTSAKKLDQATAKAILAEAGGDKEKARQIARERGFSF